MARVVVYAGDPPDGGIPANHIVSLNPQQQRVYQGQEFVMPGFDQTRAGAITFSQNGGKANSWVRVTQPAGSIPGRDWNPATGRIIGWLGPQRPDFPLWGVINTESEGVQYDIASHNFYKDVPDVDLGGGAGSTSTSGTDPYTTPGSTTSGNMTMTAKRGKELTFPGGMKGKIWYASSARESGAQDGPHPGLSLAGPGTWQASWGTPAENGLPAGVYLLTADDPDDRSTIRPASREFRWLTERAANGDEGARGVFQELDLPYPDLTAGGWFHNLLN